MTEHCSGYCGGDSCSGYVRVSTVGQVKEGFYLEQQEEEIVNFCEENDYDLIKIYEDAGISGAKMDEDDMSIDRPGLQDMLADISDEIKYIVVLTSTAPNWGGNRKMRV